MKISFSSFPSHLHSTTCRKNSTAFLLPDDLFAFLRTYFNSRSSVLRRLLAVFSSISMRLVFCSSQEE